MSWSRCDKGLPRKARKNVFSYSLSTCSTVMSRTSTVLLVARVLVSTSNVSNSKARSSSNNTIRSLSLNNSACKARTSSISPVSLISL